MNRRWNDTRLRVWLRDPENRVTVAWFGIAIACLVLLFWVVCP